MYILALVAIDGTARYQVAYVLFSPMLRLYASLYFS